MHYLIDYIAYDLGYNKTGKKIIWLKTKQNYDDVYNLL